MNYNIIAYSIYLPVTIALSIWIAKSLHTNTRAFLQNKFEDKDIASSTNNLIQTGFYLLALGFSFMYMKIKAANYYVNGIAVPTPLQNGQDTIEQLSVKLGAFTFFLGVLLFINFYIMFKIQTPKQLADNNNINEL